MEQDCQERKSSLSSNKEEENLSRGRVYNYNERVRIVWTNGASSSSTHSQQIWEKSTAATAAAHALIENSVHSVINYLCISPFTRLLVLLFLLPCPLSVCLSVCPLLSPSSFISVDSIFRQASVHRKGGKKEEN